MWLWEICNKKKSLPAVPNTGTPRSPPGYTDPFSAPYLSLRLPLAAAAEGGTGDFTPTFEAGALATGVLCRGGLKSDKPKKGGAAAGEAAGVGAGEAWGAEANGKAGAAGPGAALGVLELLEYGGASPATEADAFKEEVPKEKPTEGIEKVEVGPAGMGTGTEPRAAAAEASSFWAAGEEVGVVGVLPVAGKQKRGENSLRG